MTLLDMLRDRMGDVRFVLTNRLYARDVLRNGGAVALIGFVGTLGVLCARWVGRVASGWASRRVTLHTIDIGPLPLEIGSIDNVKLRCLVVRYGTDAYIERMASDRERYQGRLQNRVLRNRVTALRTRADGLGPWLACLWKRRLLGYDALPGDGRRIVGKFFLPVHRRMGTQFKLFFQVRANASAVRSVAEAAGEDPAGAAVGGECRAVEAARLIAERLAGQYGLHPGAITEVHSFRRLLRFPAPEFRFHLWFCVGGFATVPTADGITNNMCFPV